MSKIIYAEIKFFGGTIYHEVKIVAKNRLSIENSADPGVLIEFKDGTRKVVREEELFFED